ncbi:ParA family protein [Candidatus Woesearchaeota archaeon]|nr:ParA family protein [Candidatus Woesearchaeota archaeon]
MRTICIINNKGGVGKTTTAINLAAGLSRHDRRVLLIDLDPQSSIDTSLKVRAQSSIHDAMLGKVPIQQCITNLGTNLDVVTSSESLNHAEQYLAQPETPDLALKRILDQVGGYDYVIVDCPPSHGLIAHNVMAYCREAFIPTSTDYLGHEALRRMQRLIAAFNTDYDRDLRITRIIPTMYDRRNRICRDTLADVQNDHPELTSYPIRINSKLKEAPKAGKSIFSYARSSYGAKDYLQLVEEVISMEQSSSGGNDQEATVTA